MEVPLSHLASQFWPRDISSTSASSSSSSDVPKATFRCGELQEYRGGSFVGLSFATHLTPSGVLSPISDCTFCLPSLTHWDPPSHST